MGCGIARGFPIAGSPEELYEVRKHVARRESTTPPRRTAGGEAGTEGNLSTDKGDHYVGLDGASHKPERRADRAELAWTQAEVKRLRAHLKALLRGESRVQALGARVRDLEEETRMLFNTVESDTEATALAATLAAAAANGPPPARPPGDVGDPAANPVHPTPSGRVIRPRAAEQSAPPSAAARTAGRKTGGPLHGAAAPGGGGRPQADPAARLPQPSGSNAIHTETCPATDARGGALWGGAQPGQQ